MKFMFLYTTGLSATLLLQSGCSTPLRYQFEEALNQIPKDVKIRSVTNEYIEYYRVKTNNTVMTNNIVISTIKTNTYRAYYSVHGNVYKTKQVTN